MNQLSNLSREAGNETASNDVFLKFHSAYKARELAFNLITQINHLVKNVQRHRGISMGLLAGDLAFEKEFGLLQHQIDRRLSLLAVFAVEDGSLLSERDKSNIQQAWDTIRKDWQDDKLTDNFELHSHFVEQLRQTSLAIAKHLEVPVVFQIGHQASQFEFADDKGTPRAAKQIELLYFACSLSPTMIESMAKIRGLASFAAASGVIGYEYDRRLRYLLQCAREQHAKLLQCAQRMDEILGGELQAKKVVGNLETKFIHFMELVSNDVLSGTVIRSSSSQLFNLATVLIDGYWHVVDEGLDLMRSWHRNDLDLWVAI